MYICIWMRKILISLLTNDFLHIITPFSCTQIFYSFSQTDTCKYYYIQFYTNIPLYTLSWTDILYSCTVVHKHTFIYFKLNWYIVQLYTNTPLYTVSWIDILYSWTQTTNLYILTWTNILYSCTQTHLYILSWTNILYNCSQTYLCNYILTWTDMKTSDSWT